MQEGQFRELPRNTLDAIESGCRQAQAGAVERMFRAMGGGACLVSGGGGPSLIERLDLSCRYVENLVLEGLARIGVADRTKRDEARTERDEARTERVKDRTERVKDRTERDA
jgi:hypothetical protein